MISKITSLGISKLEAKELLKVSKNIERDYTLLKQGVPIQYLIGNVDFYNTKIYVNQNVLIPRFETETLVDKVLKLIKRLNIVEPKILDLCTGSGCIAISLSKKLNIEIDASDISEKALLVAKSNNNVNYTKVNFIKSDLLENINRKYDVIITNPPYISQEEKISPIVKKNEPNLALFSEENGLKHIKTIIKTSSKNLNKKSILAIEIGKTQGNYLIKYSKKIYPNAKIYIEKDLNERDRFLFILNNFE